MRNFQRHLEFQILCTYRFTGIYCGTTLNNRLSQGCYLHLVKLLAMCEFMFYTSFLCSLRPSLFSI